MSTLIVEICRAEKISKHNNADSLELVQVKNWQTCCPIGHYKEGELVVFIPPDSVISGTLADKFGIKRYCVQLPKDISGIKPDKYRIKATRLRGEKKLWDYTKA